MAGEQAGQDLKAGQDPQLASARATANPDTAQPGAAAANAPAAPASSDQGASQQQDGTNASAQDPRAALQSLLTQPTATATPTAGASPTPTPTAAQAQATPQATAQATQPTAAVAQTQDATPDTSAVNLTAATTPLGSTAAATPGTPAAAAARYAAVPMQHAVETVQMTIAAGARQGFSQARIQLSPESFGGIKIDLQHTSEGVVAKVVTDHEAAAQTLTQGGADLKRSLEAAGVNLVRLDIESRPDSGATARDPNHPSSQERTGTSTQSDQNTDGGEADDETARNARTLVLPGGALVNVLA